MSEPLLSEQLWQRIEPLLPKSKKRRNIQHAGRKPTDARKVMTGIIFVLKTRVPWKSLPATSDFPSGHTCRRRLLEWDERSVWTRLWQSILAELQSQGQLSWERGVVDSSSVRAGHGGEKTGKNPVDRSKLGSKHHLLVEGHGVPLSMSLTGANRHDITQLMTLVESLPPVRGKRGRPRRKPKQLQGDRAYDSEPHRRALKKGIKPLLARRDTAQGSGLGKTRWVVERSLSWLHQFRKLKMRAEVTGSTHEALMLLACAIIAHRYLKS